MTLCVHNNIYDKDLYKSAGMGELILSLVLSLIIGLIINQKYFKSKKEWPTSLTTRPEPGEPNQTAIQTGDNEEHEEEEDREVQG